MEERANLVISHFDEDLGWVQRVDRARYDVVLVSKTLRDRADIFQPVNRGCEASAYMEYIVRHYDDLPPISVFVHGHERSWHHAGTMDALVNGLDFRRTYENFNFVVDPVAGGAGADAQSEFAGFKEFVRDGRHVKQQNEVERWRRDVPELFAAIGGFRLHPRDFDMKACAQFYVHRDLIRRHTREQWRALLDTLMRRAVNWEKSKHGACTYEFSWTLLFTGHYDERRWIAEWQEHVRLHGHPRDRGWTHVVAPLDPLADAEPPDPVT